MSSEGPYGRQGYQANPSGYGGASNSYSTGPPSGGGYAAPQYGGGYGGGAGGGGASYTAPAPQGYGGDYAGAYGSQQGAVGQVRNVNRNSFCACV